MSMKRTSLEVGTSTEGQLSHGAFWNTTATGDKLLVENQVFRTEQA